MDPDEQMTVADVAQRLQQRFPTVGSNVVDRVVAETYHSLDDAPIRSFVGILVEKQARQSLEAVPAQRAG